MIGVVGSLYIETIGYRAPPGVAYCEAQYYAARTYEDTIRVDRLMVSDKRLARLLSCEEIRLRGAGKRTGSQSK
jgi:hypothetical protein